MLDQTNDNLLHADGNLESNDQETQSTNPVEEKNDESTSIQTNVDVDDSDHHLKVIDSSNAEESEDNDFKDRQSIPMEDYEKMSMENLVDEFEKLLTTDRILLVKEHVEELKKAFISHYNEFIEEKKELFYAENSPEEIFEYHLPLINKFD
jgi:hypothetical protein